MRPSKLIAAVENGIVNLSRRVRRSMNAAALLRAKELEESLSATPEERKLVEARLKELLDVRDAKRAAKVIKAEAKSKAKPQAKPRVIPTRSTKRTPRPSVR